MLQAIDNCIWIAEQPQRFIGLEVGTRMTVILLADNSLLLISPIVITPKIKQQLDSLGEVKYIIAPNLFHHLYLRGCQEIYPEAEIIAPIGIETKQPKLKIAKTFGKDNIDFNDELKYIPFLGFQAFIPFKIAVVNEIVFFHNRSKTLIITDSAFNFDRNFNLSTRLVAKLINSYQSLQPSWLEKVAIQDKEVVANSISKILAWDFERVIMAHGNIVAENAKEKLQRGYEWFLS